jgi:hypothetical protein
MKTGNKILFVVCVIAIAIGVAVYLEAAAFQKISKVTVGVVVNSGSTYYDVRYTSDDGIDRTHRGSQPKNGKHRDNEKMKVFYQTDNPDKARISDGVKGGKKVVFWGFILLLFNLASIYFGKKKEYTENYFKTTGRKVEAQIIKIDIDMETTVMKKNPYYIDCKWTDPMTGKEYRHTIKYIWQDPETLLAGRKTIDVYIDRKDPEKYFMDIAFLGESAM